MKSVPITLTLPDHLVRDLHLYISRRQISKYIAQLIEQNLNEKKENLAKEFREANSDEERNREIELWDTLEEDGLNETNSY